MGCSCVKSADQEVYRKPSPRTSQVSVAEEEADLDSLELSNTKFEPTNGDPDPDPNLLVGAGTAGGCNLDICGLENTKYIIESGTHYAVVNSLQSQVSFPRDKKPLREVCRHGDHYMAQLRIDYSKSTDATGQPPRVEDFYIIKRKSCIRVSSLSTSDGNELEFMQGEMIFDLHPECQGGSHYLANRAGFYIIRSEDNTYLHVRSLSMFGTLTSANRHNLHESFTNGLYYFATDGYFYVVKEHAEFGLVYYRTEDMSNSTSAAEMFPVSPSIASIITPLIPPNQRMNEIQAMTTQLSLPQDLDQSIQSSKPAEKFGLVSSYPAGTSESTHMTMTTPLSLAHCLDQSTRSSTSEITDSLVSSYIKPNSISLSVIKWKDASGKFETFRFKTSIIHKWRDIGNLIVPRQLLETWAKEKDAKACCDAVLSHWLDNPPPYYPATWEGLYELLNDSELGQVASDLKQAVDSATAVAVYAATL